MYGRAASLITQSGTPVIVAKQSHKDLQRLEIALPEEEDVIYVSGPKNQLVSIESIDGILLPPGHEQVCQTLCELVPHIYTLPLQIKLIFKLEIIMLVSKFPEFHEVVLLD